MDIILTWDLQIFHMINQSWEGTVIEDFLILIRNKYIWIPLYLAIITYVFSAFDLHKASYYILFIVTAVSITDIASSRIVKNSVERPRPCQEVSLQGQINQRVYCGRSYSFTSSHATNHFGIAAIMVFLFGRRRRWVGIAFFSWATLISIAQVYVGVHYPLDILGGACLGIALVRIWAKIYSPWLSYATTSPTA